MTKRKRVPRPKGELERELGEQLELLRAACLSFDNGFEASGKWISLTLRLLLYEKGTSRGLLEQLGKRACRYVDTSGPLNPRNLLTECNLVGYRSQAMGDPKNPLIWKCIPLVGMMPDKLVRTVDFATWWNEPVLKDDKKRTMTRNQLVREVSCTDGGAHVDPELDETYMAISRKNSLGWEVRTNAGVKPPDGRPELACMRQIAHELLLSLSQAYPEYAELAKPIIPERPEAPETGSIK